MAIKCKPPAHIQKQIKCPRKLVAKLYRKGIDLGYSLQELDYIMSAKHGLFTWLDGEELWRFFHENE
ncbi:hypothetical protein [Candidatus Uabimicrobium amorphum]|uniref:Uncharacterized protein n=1 Tax=Uabimicrobium amorphum TaxID=2596890 RepID=A0A5S9F3A4_UABAM|nr:hypothetical protein [Candidatus Uabimicrobium amorphum]BBM84456.1 hypothetical protein UABAM_02816 [Candidatus Uabimicrobium amorphum]